ncbi:unnamed protein product [Rotaria sp. Silwood1]|nr:unnamed protein product [Rotaria sp. Silwood1]CAF1566640.1 unnamed protein product [Rotaria sp. Silwood1]CAF3604527.1 unnamed protein product [Rotaria sp. Silwood1]CAF3669174.1 unnamed protein product [Rotaria sp. Silwood1]CAF4805762.1 unnamed protein product [Rotaria sp. Silwood1]
MNIESIQVIRFYITLCTSYVLLIFGNIGFICNFITFTSKQLRQNSCGWYLLMSTLFDCSCINFGLFTKLASEHYGSKLQHTNLVWCKIRIFLTWILQCFSTGYLILASIDRCLSTPKSQRIRSFSQIKIAHQMTCIPIILYSLTSSHLLVYFNLRKRCSPTAGTYAFFLSIYSIHQRLIHPIIQNRNRTDSQMIKITLVQVLYSFILLNIRTIYFSYSLLSTNIRKDNYRHAIESVILQISSFIFYFNYRRCINNIHTAEVKCVLFGVDTGSGVANLLDNTITWQSNGADDR